MRLLFSPRKFGEDVRRRFEFEREMLTAALDFVCLRRRGAIIGNGRCHDDDVRFGRMIVHRAAHFFRGANGNPVRAFGHLQIRGAADENHARAAANGSFRERVAHFAGRAIRQEAHGVEVFARGAGSD